MEVFLNNKYIGETDNGVSFAQQVIDERRKRNLPETVNVYYDEGLKQVHIECCAGRIRRPLIVVKDGAPLLTERHIQQLEKNEICWSDLLKQGIIEYLDTAEEENALVASSDSDLTKEHTHLEINPIVMFGLCTALVPYANFTQAPRILIGAKNQKQALGFYAANFAIRMDMDTSILYTPQHPIVDTLMYNLAEYDKHPHGQNIVVAIMSYGGYNMSDSVIVNKDSVERGFGRSAYFRPAIAEELRYAGGLTDEICVPDKDVKGYKSERDYRFLEDDGIIFPESVVKEGDVIIGKTAPPRFLSSTDEYSLASNIRRESSVSLKHGEKGVIDFVLLTENEEGNKLVQVRIRDKRIPEVGDKFISRHGQKGVIGLIIPQTDMPFTASGITPDLIFSSHSIPSRMTISHLLECLGAKVGCLAGRYINGTAFNAEPEQKLREELKRLGFKEDGTETMYNGVTGKQHTARIFIGNMYYLKLRHMVANRIQSRARGPVQLLTRQPTEGRAKEGGLRLGEMEKDTLVAHGASLLLKERFDSDKTVVPVCENCGMIAVYNEMKNESYCPICGDNVEINNIELSYAFKLVLDEFKSLCIYPQLRLKEKY